MPCDIKSEAPKIVREFLGYMRTIQGKSSKTIDEYYIDLRTFLRYIKRKRELTAVDLTIEQITISDISIEFIKSITLLDIFDYMGYLIDERNNSSVSRSRKISSLRSFFKYLKNKTMQIDINPLEEMETPKTKKSLPRYLTLDQSKLLLNTIKSYTGKYSVRDYCIVTLFLNCGMRLSELVGINEYDIMSDGRLRITGKGNKERIIYVNDACRKALDDYLKVRPLNKAKDSKALFISRNANRISPKTIQSFMCKYLCMAGLGGCGYSVHKLRHTAATLMYQYGHVDIRVLQEVLGHENLGTTEIYTHLSNSQIIDALKSNPLSLNTSNKE